MKALLLAALLAATSSAARAQTYYLDLSSQTVVAPYLTVAVEQVVDGRAGQPPIGVVYRGWGGKSAAVAFRAGLGPELTTFVHMLLPARPASHTVVLCVRSLHIGETIGGTREQAFADMTADVYAYLPDGYHFVQSVGAHASSYGFETTGRHAGHVAQMLTQCLEQVAPADWAAVARQPARTLAELPTDVPVAAGGRRSHAILREAPRRGLYYRLEHFLNNRPDTISPFVVDTIRRGYNSRLATVKWLLVARVRPLAGTAARHGGVPPNLWGFSDGHQVFVRYDKQFYPLMRQGSFFTFVGEAPVDILYTSMQSQHQSQAGVMGGGIIGGAIGGAIAGATAGGMPDHTAEPMAYSIDPRTGAIEPYPGPHTPARQDTAYVYVYRLPHPGAAPLKVYVEGIEMGALAPGHYLEVPWTRFGKPMQLCLGNWPVAKPCQYVVPNTNQLNYLKINEPTAPQPWQWMPPRQGAADLDELDQHR